MTLPDCQPWESYFAGKDRDTPAHNPALVAHCHGASGVHCSGKRVLASGGVQSLRLRAPATQASDQRRRKAVKPRSEPPSGPLVADLSRRLLCVVQKTPGCNRELE